MKSKLYKELKKCIKDKKKYKKLYSDWEDNEFNCGNLKFIWGICPDDRFTPSFNTLNDISIYYNRDTHKYLLDIDSEEINIPLLNNCIEYLHKTNDVVAQEKYNPLAVSNYQGVDFFSGNSLKELECKLKILSRGLEK